MNISEVIRKLEVAKEKYGDLNCITKGSNIGAAPVQSVYKRGTSICVGAANPRDVRKSAFSLIE